MANVDWTPELAKDALEDWAKKEITDTADRFDSFVKFFFTVSATSIAAFVTILNLSKEEGVAVIDIFFYLSMAAYLLSIIFLMGAIIRTDREMGNYAILADEYKKDFEFYNGILRKWAICWGGGLVLSGFSLYF